MDEKPGSTERVKEAVGVSTIEALIGAMTDVDGRFEMNESTMEMIVADGTSLAIAVTSEIMEPTLDAAEDAGRSDTIELAIDTSEGIDSTAEATWEIGRPEETAEFRSEAMPETIELTTEMIVDAGTSDAICVASNRMLLAWEMMLATGRSVTRDSTTEMTDDRGRSGTTVEGRSEATILVASPRRLERTELTTEITVGAGTSEAT